MKVTMRDIAEKYFIKNYRKSEHRCQSVFFHDFNREFSSFVTVPSLNDQNGDQVKEEQMHRIEGVKYIFQGKPPFSVVCPDQRKSQEGEKL